jgi:hypothetical protein
MIAGRATGVYGLRLEQDAQLGHRRSTGSVVLAVHPYGAAGGLVESGDHPHGGGFARPVRAEEPGHGPGLNHETQTIDGDLGAVPLREVLDLDHRV